MTGFSRAQPVAVDGPIGQSIMRNLIRPAAVELGIAEHIGWPDRESSLYRVGTFMEDFSINHADALMACSANIANFTAGFDS